jgi:tellurite resistance protein TerC
MERNLFRFPTENSNRMPFMPLPGLDGIHASPISAPFAMGVAEPPSVNIWCWLAFALLAVLLVAVDLLALRRRHEQTLAKSAVSVTVWCLLALAFNGFIAWWMGGTAALQFATGYLLEWSMSMDNVFVFAVIFRHFQVPPADQHRILIWGILGAMLMRLAFILAGAALIARFQFVLPLFGLFLIYTGLQMARHSSSRTDPQNNFVLRFARRWLPLAEESESRVGFSPPVPEDGLKPILQPVDYGGRFLVRQAGRLRITPPLLVLLVVEGTDLLFAVDSVPAIFGVTRDPFIVFTSNVFAILGLRALYFLLAGLIDRFRYLHYGLAAVLAFVGLKMVGEIWLPEVIPAWASLAVTVSLLGGSIAVSLLASRGKIEK